MKLKVSLSKHNTTGSVAYIGDNDDNDMQIAGGMETSPRNACLSAAKALRDAAARFELLAQEEEPYQCSTHRRINSAKLTPNA